jgi:glycosyltransferase involved in cell wall biosynthesis
MIAHVSGPIRANSPPSRNAMRPTALILTHHTLEREAPQVRYIAEYLSDRGYSVDLLGPVAGAYHPARVRVIRIRQNRMRNLVLVLQGSILSLRPRYSLIVGVDEPGALVGIFAKRARPGVKTALYFLDLFIDVRGSKLTRLAHRALHTHGSVSDLIIDTNEQRSALRQAYVGQGPAYTVLHNASPRCGRVNIARALDAQGGLGNGLNIVYAGSVHPAACLEAVVRALGMTTAPAHLLVVGWGGPEYVQRLTALAAAYNCSSRIDFHPAVSREALLPLLSRHDVGLALYRTSADAPLNEKLCSPNKVYEYMAAALPVITSDSPTMIALVRGNGWGLCVPPEDPAAISSAIERLWRDPARRATMGARAGSLHHSTMNLEFQAEQALSPLRG